MIPLHFGGRDRPLFGCYDPAEGTRRRAGVVLFNPTGWEMLRAYRTIRALAARLAENGFDVLRFDYSGTGDSWGGQHTDATWSQWMQDVGDALEEIRGIAGVDRVHLIGIRQGGRLAMAAAAAHSSIVGRIVLWDPAPLPPRTTPARVTTSSGGATTRDPPSLETPPAVLDGLALERPSVPEALQRRTLRALSHGQTLPDDLVDLRGELLIGESEGPPCWVQEADFGAGAVPTGLVGQISAWLAAEGRKP